MSQKKKKAPEAQQLIDSLLDERTPALGTTDNAAAARLTFDSRDVSPQNASPARPTRVAPQSAAQQAAHAKNDETLPIPSDDEATKTNAVGLNNSASTEASDQESIDRFDNTVRMDSRKPKAKTDDHNDFNSPNATFSMTAQQRPAEATQSETHHPESSRVDRLGITDIKSVVRMRDRFQDKPADFARNQNQNAARSSNQGASFSSAEASLKQSESLRLAQNRITELENELERIRRENEQLATAGETLRRRTDELLSKSENLEISARESDRIHDEEKKVFRGQLQSKDREILELRNRNEEMEGRLESNFKKIRVRERELEHRLEITKMESQTLIAGKDKMILELKRQIDTLVQENDYGKQKSQELFNQYKEKQETVRRVVRALRIALTVLEGDEDASSGMKKAE